MRASPTVPFDSGRENLLDCLLEGEGYILGWTLQAYAEVPCPFVKCPSWHLFVFLHFKRGLK